MQIKDVTNLVMDSFFINDRGTVLVLDDYPRNYAVKQQIVNGNDVLEVIGIEAFASCNGQNQKPVGLLVKDRGNVF